jgi:hypothetical protein
MNDISWNGSCIFSCKYVKVFPATTTIYLYSKIYFYSSELQNINNLLFYCFQKISRSDLIFNFKLEIVLCLRNTTCLQNSRKCAPNSIVIDENIHYRHNTMSETTATIPEPSYASFPYYAPKFRNMVAIGSSVIVVRDEIIGVSEGFVIDGLFGNKSVVVGIILSHHHETNNLRLNLFQRCNVQDSNQQIMSPTIGLAAGMKELVQTTAVIDVNASSVVDIAFLFQLDDIISGTALCQGIRNCFLIRYQYYNGSYSTKIKFQTFPSHHPHHTYFSTCFLFRIWSCICKIQDILWSALNRATERQCKFGESIKFSIDQEMMDYLVFKSVPVVKLQQLPSRSVIRATTTKGLRRVAVKVNRNASILRYETEDQLQLLRCIIGSGYTVGMQKKRPKLNLPDKIQINDPFHVIIGGTVPETPTLLRTQKSGIDIIHNKYNCIMTVRYEKYIYNNILLHNINGEDKLSNNLYFKEMMSGMVNVSQPIKNIRINSYINRVGDGILKVSRFVESSNKVVLCYVSPKEKRGNEIFEDDLVKLQSEIQQYVYESKND